MWSVFKTVTALLVVATMAVPASLWAKDTSEGSDKDAVPVVLEPIVFADGTKGYFLEAPIPADQEKDFVSQLAQNNPRNLTLAVSGPNDPVLEAVPQSGHAPGINSFIVGDADEAQVLKSAPASVRQKLKDQFEKIKALCANEKFGLFSAAFSASAESSYIMYETASVADGMKALVAIFAWAAFQSMNSEGWDWYLNKGGEKLTKFMAWALGRDVTQNELQMYEAAGKFHATWLANAALVTYVFASAGTYHGLNWAGLAQSAWFGYIAATDILDPNISQKIKIGALPATIFKKFIFMRIIIAEMLQVASYFNPHVQLFLFGVTTLGILHLATSHRVDPEIARQTGAVKGAIQNLIGFLKSKVADCAGLLRGKQKVAGGT